MSEQTVLDELRDQLVAGVPRYERRKRRRAGVAVAAIIVAAAGLATLVSVDGSESRPVVVSPSTSIPERLVPAGIEAVVVATNGNQFGLSITDLRNGTVLEYPRGTHAIGPGAVAGAVLSSRRDLMIWKTGEQTQLFPKLADRDGIPIGSIRGERTVVFTEGGGGAWILAAGDGAKPLEFVDLDTREVRLSTTVPAGSRLITTLGNDAVIEPSATLPADDVTLVKPSGAKTRHSVPEPANLVAIGAQGSVWIAAGGERLLMLDAAGQQFAQVPAPFGRWTMTGQPTIPSNSPGLRTITADGERVLVALTDPADVNGGTRGFVVANLADGTPETVYVANTPDAPVNNLGSAFWAGDDKTILLIDSDGGEQQSVTAFNPVNKDQHQLEGAVPRGYFVIAAG